MAKGWLGFLKRVACIFSRVVITKGMELGLVRLGYKSKVNQGGGI